MQLRTVKVGGDLVLQAKAQATDEWVAIANVSKVSPEDRHLVKQIWRSQFEQALTPMEVVDRFNNFAPIIPEA